MAVQSDTDIIEKRSTMEDGQDVKNRENSSLSFRSALIGAVATLLLTPISVWIGFTLNSIFARPILSIEVASIIPLYEPTWDAAEIYNLPNVGVDGRPILPNLQSEVTPEPSVRGSREGIVALDTMRTYWENELAKVAGLQDSTVKGYEFLEQHAATLGLRRTDLLLAQRSFSQGSQGTADKILASRISEIEGKIELVQMFALRFSSRKSCMLYINIMMQNRGDTPGLIYYQSDLEFEDGSTHKLSMSPPPQLDQPDFMAVPVSVTNADGLGLGVQSTVGQIPARSIELLWFTALGIGCEQDPKRLRLKTLRDRTIVYDFKTD